MGAEPDFSGWATKANLRCTDGRTITSDAFKDQDKQQVPLVWNHGHNDPENVLGYAILEHRDEGVYCSGYFNASQKALNAKEAVRHGDIKAMSIFANKLVEKSKTVLHGVICEVSLVLKGANAGALIENVSMTHSDGSYEELEDVVIIYSEEQELVHADVEPEPEKEEEVVEHADDTKDETLEDIFNTMDEKQKTVTMYLVGQARSGGTAAHSDDAKDDEAPDEELINEVYHSMDEKQQQLVQDLIGYALKHADTDAATADETDTETDGADASADNAKDTAAHSDDKEGTTMRHNAFDDNDGAITGTDDSKTLAHSEQIDLLKDAEAMGVKSLKHYLTKYASSEAALAHGINNLGVLFPDAKNVGTTPEWLTRRQEWVSKVLTGTRHVPFAKVKSQYANLTEDEARAKGYIKGNLKKEEFFALTERETGPQTIYKKQKLDRDDIIDVIDFDLVVWLKGEMRLMLDEEIARAIMFGDGREAGDPDKIKEANIRPIVKDDDFYNTKVYVNIDDANSTMEEVMDALVLNRRHYRGTGNPTFFTSETFLAKCFMVKDGVGRRLYNTVADVSAQLRVNDIVTCEILDEPSSNVVGVLVNLADYTVGSDRGGDIALFDDFDIDFNQYKYLIETRLSGALVKAKSAVTVLKVATTVAIVDSQAPTYDKTTHQLTVPTTTGVEYRNKATNAVLTTGAPLTLADGDKVTVLALAKAGYSLPSSAGDEYNYTYAAGRVAASLY